MNLSLCLHTSGRPADTRTYSRQPNICKLDTTSVQSDQTHGRIHPAAYLDVWPHRYFVGCCLNTRPSIYAVGHLQLDVLAVRLCVWDACGQMFERCDGARTFEKQTHLCGRTSKYAAGCISCMSVCLICVWLYVWKMRRWPDVWKINSKSLV